MNCQRIEDHLSAYADGELEGALHEQVDSHLAECQNCRDTLTWLTTFHGLMAQVPEETPSQQFHLELMARVATVAPQVGSRPAR